MRMRSGLSLVLVIALLGVAMSVQADAPRGITGGVDFVMWTFDGTQYILATTSATFAVREVNAENHEAMGSYRWWVKDGPVNDQLALDVTWVEFAAGDPAEAFFCGVVRKLTNWPEDISDVQYFKIHVRDGGSPGTEGDAVAFSVGDRPAGYTCDPCVDSECPTTGFSGWMPALRGNITVHR
jgi:hypothetical protein